MIISYFSCCRISLKMSNKNRSKMCNNEDSNCQILNILLLNNKGKGTHACNIIILYLYNGK